MVGENCGCSTLGASRQSGLGAACRWIDYPTAWTTTRPICVCIQNYWLITVSERNMKSIVLVEPGKFRLEDIAEPPPPSCGEAQVRVLQVGICGTDLHAFEGKQPF